MKDKAAAIMPCKLEGIQQIRNLHKIFNKRRAKDYKLKRKSYVCV